MITLAAIGGLGIGGLGIGGLGIGGLGIAHVGLGGITIGRAEAATAPAAEQVVVIDGRGFGHGVGMAQDGAYWLGRSGRSASQILRLFYPGTAVASRGGSVRVPIAAASTVTIAFTSGGAVDGRRVPVGSMITVRSVPGGLAVTTDVPSTAGTSHFASVSLRGHLAHARLGLLPAQGDDAGSPTTTGIVVPQDVVPPIALAGDTPTTTTTTAAPQDTRPVAAEDTTAGSPVGASARGAASTTTTTAAPRPLVVASAPDGGTLTIGARRYRGTLELRSVGGVRVVNELDVEQYLRGMGEIRSPDWPAATLQSQAIAARTYALRAMQTAGEVCPTQRCQVYLGAQAEYPAMDAAVSATRGKVLAYDGKLAATFYSASGGGTIATPEEAFGASGTSLPYLQAGVYPTGDVQAWTRRLSLPETANRLGYPGTLRSVAVTAAGPSGRPTEITLDGDAGTILRSGAAVTRALRLRSNAFSITIGDGVADAGDAAGAEAIDPSLADDLGAATDPDGQTDLLAPVPDGLDTSIVSDSSAAPEVSVPATPPRRSAAKPRRSAGAPTTTAQITANAAADVSTPSGASADHTADVVLAAIAATLVALGVTGLRRSRRNTRA